MALVEKKAKRPVISHDVYKRGVRRDGTPWITWSNKKRIGNVIRLLMPNDNDYLAFEGFAEKAEAWRRPDVNPPKGGAA